MSTSYLWYATRGAGAVSLLLLSAVTVLGILSFARFESAGWPRFVTTGFQRNLSLLAVVLLALHIVTALKTRAVLLGGYFGAWLPAADAWGLPLDGPTLQALGLSLGAAVVAALDVADCVVEIAER